MSVGNVNRNVNLAVVDGTSIAKDTAQAYTRSKDLQKEMSDMVPKSLKTISRMGKFQGEVPSIIINALGTGLIAPIFIKYNFLSKTDDDTRTYSAMRQPISAILAVATQGLMVIPFNRLIDNMCNKGYLGARYNKSAFPDVEFIQKQIKRQNPKLSSKEVKELADKKYLENLCKIVENAHNGNTIEYKIKGKKVELSPEEVKNLLQETTEDMLKNSKDKPEELAIIKKMQEAIKSGEKSTIKELSELAKKIPDSHFAFEVVQKHISNVGQNIKAFRQVVGLGVSLAILPLTCSALNWVYPRFMDTFFPGLNTKKKPKQATQKDDTFVKSTTQKPQETTQKPEMEVHK